MVKIMMNERESLGLVLKTSDYQENAALINLLTPSGKLNLIVRGAKKNQQ
jgi:recombinational DNA repair protein (RecF pathway)